MSTIDTIFQKHKEDYHAASFTVIDATGKVLHSSHHGNSNVDGTGPPVTSNSVYWTASMTKVFTAAAAMIVVERGLISLDDEVGKVVSELAEPDILTGFEEGKPILRKAKEKLTLRNLLTHSSGFVYQMTNENLKKWAVNSGRGDVDPGSYDAFRQPLTFEPGEGWAYGPGIDWAGRVVEVLSGKTLDEFIQQNICDKLGLTATTFHPENHPDYPKRRVELAMRGKDGKLSAMPIPFPMPAKDDLGGTGLYTTPQEYTKFLGTLLAGGGDILKRESVEQIFKPQLKDNKHLMAKFSAPGAERINRTFTTAKTVDMGLSVAVNLDQVPNPRSPGSVSWGGYANTFWWLDPKAGICASLFFQVLPPADEVSLKILDEVESALYQEIKSV